LRGLNWRAAARVAVLEAIMIRVGCEKCRIGTRRRIVIMDERFERFESLIEEEVRRTRKRKVCFLPLDRRSYLP